MHFRTTRKLLVLLPLLCLAVFATSQDTLFTYLFDGGFGSPCAPASVNFYPQTSISNPSYTWKVNGVTFSNQEEPIRIFPVGGDYNICLELDDGNAVATYCESITIFDPPTVTLGTDVSLGCSPLPVNFILSSTTNIDSVVWDLGDGTVINQNGSDTLVMIYNHVYTTPGNFTPIVTAFDENGCEVTVVEPNAVEVINTPTPSFTADETIGCNVPHTVNFVNNTNGGSDVSYYWDFGVDASSNSTQENPSFTYSALGAYDVTLIVTNNATSCADTLLLEDFVSIGEFNGFQYDLLDDGDCSVTEVAFSFYDSGNIQSVLWDFGDGNTSTQINPIYTYTTAGCYIPSLTINTTDGCNYSTTALECINSNGPISVNYIYSGDVTTCDPVDGTTVNFTGVSPLATSWMWDFGGLGTSTLQNPSFTFTGTGSYPVTLTVTYPDDCVESITNVTVRIEPIEAQFSSNVVDGCKDLQVFFFNETEEIDAIASYEWDFGGGVGINSLENPVVMFSDTGSYDISLIVTTGSGCVDTLLMEDYIQVGIPSEPGFSADPLISCLEDQIEFTSMSGPLVDEWEWFFGDGGMSSEEDPMHEYTDTGFFDVTLITYFHGCPDTLLVEEYIYINVPKADFSFDQDCSSPGEIQFLDESAGAETWSWDFGDGSTSSIPNPAHTYAANGSYIVNLTVTNSETGCSHVQSNTVNVTSSAPEFTLSDLDICVGDTIFAINNSIGASCYTWTFPFGVGMITDAFCDPDPQFYFPAPGCYYGFSLTISDGTNCVNTYYFTDTVCVSASVSDFATADIEGCAPHTATFNNSAYGINGNITGYLWDFGDSTTSTDPNPSHIYTETGAYTVSLTVENESGCIDELVMDSLIVVDRVEPFFIPQVTDCTSQSVDFTNASVSYDNNMSYAWDFGDGNSSSAVSPSHSYTTAGVYNVCLTATNNWGCTEQFCSDVNFQPLAVDFVADQTYKSCPEPPLVSAFTDLSVNASSWSWDFGDGATSSLQSPSHSYNETGTYTVCLTVTNQLGCSATECKVDYIEVDGPSGTLTASPIEGCAALEVEFIVTSENAFQYKWDFGDGFVIDSLASGDSDTITYVYENAGTYTPVVLVEDISGCQIPVVGQTITVENVISNFTSNISEVCEGAQTPIDFEITFDDPGSVISVTWEFPGSSSPTYTGLNPTGIIYDGAGYYSVIVSYNTTFCQATITRDSVVYVHPAPVTDFMANPESHCDQGAIFFQSQSTTLDGDVIDSYSWTVENETYTDPTFFHYFDEPGDYLVTLATVSGFGCTSSTEQTITIFEDPNVNAGQNVFLCNNETANLNASVQTTDQVSYLWSPVDGLSCTDCPNPMASPTATTMYYVLATTINNCVSTDSILVEVTTQPEPMVTILPDTTICEGESVTLTTGFNLPVGSYQWDTSQPGLSCYDCPDPVASPNALTVYSVTISSDEGCTATNQVAVDIIPSEDLIDANPIICVGESTSLEVNIGSDFMWSPATGLSCTDCPNPQANPDSTITYTVTALIENQCLMTDQVTVIVVHPEDISAGDDFEICEGQTTVLDGSYPYGTSTWTYNGDVIATDEPTPFLTPSQSGVAVLEVMIGTCVMTDTVIVEVIEKVSIYAEDIQVCVGDTAHLEVTGDAEAYLWSGLGLSDPTSQTPFVIPSETATYIVQGTYGDCEADTQLVTVEVLSLAEINLPSIEYFAEGESVQLNANISNSGNFTYYWTPPAHLSCTDCPDPVATPDENITYQLFVENELGCVDSASINVKKIFICNSDLIHVPNAFTPNGDGNNDRFNVWSDLEINMVRIYNRWGEIVFEDAGGKTGWDGTWKGQKLNRDVFVYHIEATCEFNGQSIIKTGDVTLIR